MKQGGFLKRKTSLKARKGFNPPKSGLKRTKLRKVSKDDSAQSKVRIQALLRQIAIKRDGGCVLRDYPDSGECGGYRNDGELILQAEHLITRSNSISFADMRNIVCLCRHHHGKWKPQHSRLYWEIIREVIGEERWKWIKLVEKDKKPHRFTLHDWYKIELALKQESNGLQK